MSVPITITAVDVSPREVEQAVRDARRLAAGWEHRFSRFRPDSQLALLNAARGMTRRLDARFIDVLEAARAAVSRTEGRFDPAILPALEAAGYDRDFEQVRVAPRPSAGCAHPAAGRAAWDLVHIDRARQEVRLPPGMRIDLGGVAKGMFVDRLAGELAAWPGGAVDAGGDLRVWGRPPAGDGWIIGVEDPFQPGTDRGALHLHAPGGAGVATSGTYRRRWQINGRGAHHLIDPRTGFPVTERIRSVTALAADTRTAEIAAKALLIAAADRPPVDCFDAILAVLTDEHGQITTLTEEKPHEPDLEFSYVTPDDHAA